jgi:tetratricopeptide (TPR) repeat protein
MRYIGPDPGFSAAEAARAKGDLVAARQGYEEFVARHPNSPAGLFWLGFANYYLKDWPAAERANRQLEEWLPDHPSVIYNRATTLMELGQYDAAIPRLERLTTLNPRNYGAQLNLYSCYRKAGDTAKAAARLQVLRELFPTDPEVRRLVENPG